ncbi:MAG: type IV pilus secretin PilQ [Bdellovibrionaceae bacterium]|nr:type IV pilus secretin PilQ [Pseudobdellovibrionaceae bacterium]
MDGFKKSMRLGISAIVIFAMVTGCSTQSVDSPEGEQDVAADDFSDFESSGDNAGGDFGTEAEDAIEGEIAEDSSGGGGSDEFSQFEEAPSEDGNAAVDPGGGDSFAGEDPLGLPAEEAPMDQQAQGDAPVEEIPPAEIPPTDIPGSDPMAQQPPMGDEPAMGEPTGQIVNITELQFRANDNGGTVVVQGDGPMQFNQRLNSDTNQFVIEIPNSKLPARLKRPLNTRDFGGTVGAVDAYQNAGSTTTRVVVQLRPNSPEPVIQAEGNALLVVTSPPMPSSDSMAQNTSMDQENYDEGPTESDIPPSKLMTSENLEDFLANNQTFYGKKISIETDEVEVREVFKLISDEANVNLILADGVDGKVSVKLKNVPWDQALVLLMKTKKLGYTRSGNVLRIANIADIQKEEKDSFDLQAQRRQNAAPKVRTLQVNYAKVEDLEKQIKNMLSKTGTVVSDPRTSALIITDFEENIDRAAKVVQSLDVPPQQVLIEGKIVEAVENSEESMGIQWNFTGAPTQIGSGRNVLSSSQGPVRMNNNFSVNPDVPANRSMTLGFNLGTFDILGDLNATLNLFEQEGKVRVLSSPRIVTMHNEKANIEQVLQIPVRQTQISNGSTITSVSFKDTKLALEVTPQLTNDGAVMMKIDMLREFAGEIANNQDGAPSINSRKASTRVMVKNGQTAVIGGIYQNDARNTDTLVPGLGRLPVIGWLFRSNNQSEQRNELLMFLTPRILGQLDSQVIPSQTGGSSGESDDFSF